MHRLRVFLSYAHADRKIVDRIDAVLAEMGLKPVWDRELSAGQPFDDRIRRHIATAHVFMPVLTANASQRPWVHQEIGYALGIGVPVVPVALDAISPGMIAGLHAVVVNEDLSGFREALERAKLESWVLPSHIESELERIGLAQKQIHSLGEIV